MTTSPAFPGPSSARSTVEPPQVTPTSAQRPVNVQSGSESLGSKRPATKDPDRLVHLNAQQFAAVEHRGAPLLVVAGAGTGKTRTLVNRVASLLDEGVDPSRVLLLTFTRRAAAEMTGRVAAHTASSTAGQIWSGTFHSVANRLLRNYGSAAGLPKSFTVMDNADVTDLFSVVRSEQGINEKGRRVPQSSTIAAIYSKVVNTQTKLAEILKTDFPWCESHAALLKTVFAEYTEKKRRSHVLDFDDLLLFWRALLQSPVGEAMRCMFDHILVDEYQDSNQIQAEILSLMRGPDTQICAVGDDAQAIYRFRAATVENMWNFTTTYPSARVVGLEQNYRSTSPILSVANQTLSQHLSTRSKAQGSEGIAAPIEGFEKTLWTERTGGARPQLCSWIDETEQSKKIADKILAARERGIDLREQAVLYRAGYHGDALELELTRRDIPYVKYGGLKYLDSAHIKDVLSLLRIVENPDDELAWHRVLQMIQGVGPATASRLLTELRVSKPNSDGLARFLDGVGRFPVDAQQQVAELRTSLKDCLDQDPSMPNTSEKPLSGDLNTQNHQRAAVQLERLRAFCEMTFPNRYPNSEARLCDIDRLASTAESYGSRSRFLTELTLDPPERTGDFAVPPHLDDDWLTLSTIHSAKGLEWRAVYLLHAADGNIPSEMALGDDQGLAEELRLLYVALTRAKEELTVSFPLRYHVHRYAKDDRHHFAQLSRFLVPARELFDDQTAETQVPEAPAENLSTIGVNADVTGLLETLWE